MVYGQTDKLTGADRKAVLIAEPDAHERGLADGDDVLVRSEHGELRGRQVAPVKRGNAIVHWPEGNLLIGRDCRSPESGIPDYTAWVEVLAPD